MGRVYQYSIGLVIQVDLGDSLAGGSAVQFKLRAPSGALATKTATITDAANGIAQYTLVSGDLNEAGRWQLQAIYRPLGLGDDDSIPGEIATFDVHKPL